MTNVLSRSHRSSDYRYRRASRRRRRLRFDPEVVAARAIAVGSAVGGAMAAGHATGFTATDRLFTGLFAGVVAVAASRARRWAWLVIAGGTALMALAADDNAATAMAIWALVLAVGSVALNKRDRAIGALVGGLAIQALLRIRGFGDSGASALLTTAIVAPVLVSAYRQIPTEPHRRLKRGILIGTGVAALFLLPVVVGSLLARSQIERGISEVRAGFAAAEDGDKTQATAHFRRAESSFKKGKTFVGSWWTAPARALPIGGLQAQVLTVATAEGDALARVAGDLADAQQAALSVDDGTMSIEAVTKLTKPLDDARAALEHAAAEIDDVDSMFLLPPLADRLDTFDREVTKALPAARNAQAAIKLAPALLGDTAPRNYLVLFTTPAETRGAGGFIGSWALLNADRGHISMTSSGRIRELNDYGGPPRTLTGPERYLSAYSTDFHPDVFFQNVTASPDFHDVGVVAAELAPQTVLGTPVDGVVLIDPVALAAMLQLTGPVEVDGLDRPLTAQNAAQIFLYDQYALFPQKRTDDPNEQGREDFLADALKATFDQFLDRHLPGPQTMVDALGPMVEQRRLLAYSTHADEENLFTQLGMDGAFPSPSTGDLLSLVSTNRGGNKLDAYLQRDVSYDVTYSPSTGDVQATATVVLHNTAPPDGLPFEVSHNDDDLPVGTNQTTLTLYSPLTLTGLTGNGQPLGSAERTEFGYSSYSVYLDLPPQSDTTVVFSLGGSSKPAETYRLRVLPQPLAKPDKLAVTVRAIGGWTPQRRQGQDGQPGVAVKDGVATLTIDPKVAADVSVGFR